MGALDGIKNGIAEGQKMANNAVKAAEDKFNGLQTPGSSSGSPASSDAHEEDKPKIDALITVIGTNENLIRPDKVLQAVEQRFDAIITKFREEIITLRGRVKTLQQALEDSNKAVEENNKKLEEFFGKAGDEKEVGPTVSSRMDEWEKKFELPPP